MGRVRSAGTMSPTAAIDAGLEHVVMGESRISLVEGERGGLSFRGFQIDELAGHVDYESVVHLLLRGGPPTPAERVAVGDALRSRRELSEVSARLVAALPASVPPLEAMRTLLSSLGDGRSYPYPPTESQGFTLVAQAPTLLAAFVRHARGEPPVTSRADLGHVANYLYLLHGREPSGAQVRALEAYCVMLADHGMNASTFALRVAISTQSDLASAATAALATLKGPLHGGAPAKVSDMLDSVGTPGAAPAWIDAALDRKDRLMGFGHRAYKTEDPRAKILKRIAREVADPARFALAEAVESAAVAALERRRPGHRLYTNVEFYGAVVLEAAGLPRELFTPTFALARTAGWAAHAMEQAGNNRLIRPEVAYVGPAPGRRWPAA